MTFLLHKNITRKASENSGSMSEELNDLGGGTQMALYKRCIIIPVGAVTEKTS